MSIDSFAKRFLLRHSITALLNATTKTAFEQAYEAWLSDDPSQSEPQSPPSLAASLAKRHEEATRRECLNVLAGIVATDDGDNAELLPKRSEGPRDLWGDAIDASIHAFVERFGKEPLQSALFNYMLAYPPKGFDITETTDRGEAALSMPIAEPLGKEALKKRLYRRKK